MNKQELRTRFRKYRKALSETQRFSASVEICERLKPFIHQMHAETLLGYLATSAEVNVDSIVLYAQNNNISTFLPKVEGNQLVFSEFEGFEEVSIGSFGIREPQNNSKLWNLIDGSAETAGIVLIPGVAFDLHGNRLGQGGGYYDRFLKTLPHTLIKVGVCFECQLSEKKLPTSSHDVQMDCVVFEGGFYQLPAEYREF